MDIKMKNIIDTVRQLAKNEPQYVYPALALCTYLSHGPDVPSCLFGRAFLQLGYPEEQLAVLDETDGTAIGSALEALDIHGNAEEVKWCEIVQSYQDNGTAWGECVKQADIDILDVEYINVNV